MDYLEETTPGKKTELSTAGSSSLMEFYIVVLKAANLSAHHSKERIKVCLKRKERIIASESV